MRANVLGGSDRRFGESGLWQVVKMATVTQCLGNHFYFPSSRTKLPAASGMCIRLSAPLQDRRALGPMFRAKVKWLYFFYSLQIRGTEKLRNQTQGSITAVADNDGTHRDCCSPGFPAWAYRAPSNLAMITSDILMRK